MYCTQVFRSFFSAYLAQLIRGRNFSKGLAPVKPAPFSQPTSSTSVDFCPANPDSWEPASTAKTEVTSGWADTSDYDTNSKPGKNIDYKALAQLCRDVRDKLKASKICNDITEAHITVLPAAWHHNVLREEIETEGIVDFPEFREDHRVSSNT